MSAMMLTGCGGSTTEDESAANSTYEEGETAGENGQNENAVVVKVTAVDGNTVTASVGQLDGKKGGPGGVSANDGAMPEGKPEGEEGKAGGFGGGMFTESGETVTFTITDSTSITMGGPQGNEEATVADITVDSILEITLDENNQAVTIVVRSANPQNMEKKAE